VAHARGAAPVGAGPGVYRRPDLRSLAAPTKGRLIDSSFGWASVLTPERFPARKEGRQAEAPAARTSPSAGLLIVNRESRLLRRHRKATFDALRHPRHQYLVPEAFPALLGIVNCDDRPAICRRSGHVEDLALRQAPVRSDAQQRPTPRIAPSSLPETGARRRRPCSRSFRSPLDEPRTPTISGSNARR
jgi:hypothetical protein